MEVVAAPAATEPEVPAMGPTPPVDALPEVSTSPEARAVLDKAGAMVIAPAIAKVEKVDMVDMLVLQQLGVGVGSSATFHDAETRDAESHVDANPDATGDEPASKRARGPEGGDLP